MKKTQKKGKYKNFFLKKKKNQSKKEIVWEIELLNF